MKVNLGCGPHALQGWLNFDLDAHPDVIQLDLSKGFNYSLNEKIDFAYSEHFIEHIERNEAINLLNNIRTKMNTGAVIRLSTPDLFVIIHNYKNFDFSKKIMGDVWAPKSPAQYVNEGMRFWGHKFIYDFEEMYDVLKQCGFGRIEKKKWRQSDFEQLKNLEVRPDYEDLIVEAVAE